MPTTKIIATPEDEVRAGTLGRLLREHNYRSVGEYPEGQSVNLNAVDEGGKRLGGFRGEIYFHWLLVNVLYVEEQARGKGIGARLLTEGEAQAKAKGARHARLDTFDWQAPGFYLKQGYRDLLTMPDYFRGHGLSFMVKDLYGKETS
jgi:GNAT superfamily N-acetyltransferase